MRRILWWIVAAGLMLTSAAHAAQLQDGVYQDVGAGYSSDVLVECTIRGGKIEAITAQRTDGEKSEYHQSMVSDLLPRIVAQNGIEGVDATSGATGSSESVFEAMRGIIAQAEGGVSEPSGAAGGDQGDKGAMASPSPTTDPKSAETTLGLGGAANFRIGPGKDEGGKQVYSFNIAMAAVLFDRQGRILRARCDVYEVATPNYDGETMPNFSGWPGEGLPTEESAQQELAAWKTKRERGAGYGMNKSNDWFMQMDAYERWMTGKTTQELRDWYGKYTTSAGRPLRADGGSDEDKAKYAQLSDDEKQSLADVTSSATMSLSDAHGLILESIEKAYENRVAVE